MRVVKASAEHIELLVPLFDSYRKFYDQPSDIEGAQKFLQSRFNNNDSVIFIAVEEKEDRHTGIGFTQLYPVLSSVSMMKAWILNDLYVDESYRKQGIAEQLLKAAEEFGKSASAKYLMLETQNSNLPAQKLYEKLGWKKDTEHSFYFLSL